MTNLAQSMISTINSNEERATKEPGICEVSKDTLAALLTAEEYIHEIMCILGVPETTTDGVDSAPRDLRENVHMIRESASRLKTDIERIKAFL